MRNSSRNCNLHHSLLSKPLPEAPNLTATGLEHTCEGKTGLVQSADSQKAIYGKVTLLRETCPVCEVTAIVAGGTFTCCGATWQKKKATNLKRMTSGFKRKDLTPVLKQWILHLQRNKCFYCDIDLTNGWYRQEKSLYPKKVKTHFDHIVPWVFSMNDDVSNFVAACSVYNLVKKDRIFNDVESLVKFVLWRREYLNIVSM
jgi:hypothetical protein